jgi:hypothetical protein
LKWGCWSTDPLDGEETIAAEPDVPHLKTMREQIAQDRELLAALRPDSDAYRRLQARITDNATRLLNYEEVLQLRYDNLAAERAGERRPAPPRRRSDRWRDLRCPWRAVTDFHVGQLVDRRRLCPARRRRD